MSAHHPSIQDGPILTYPSVEVAQPLEALPETQESTDMSSAHHSQPDLLFNSSPAFGLQLDQSHLSEFPFPKMPGSSFKNFSARPLMRIPPRLDLHSSTKREEHWSHLGTPPLCTSASSTPRSSGGLTPTDSLLSKSGSSWRFSLTSFRESSTSDPSSGDDCAYAQDSDLESDLDEDVPELGDFDPEVEGETFSSKFMRTYKTLPLALNDYTIDCELGTGGFGFVVKGTRRDNGQQVAIKCIFKNLMPGRGLVISSRWKNGSVEIPREADMLLRIDHPAVVKLIDLWEDEQLFYLVMEYHGASWVSGSSDGDSLADSTILHPSSLANTRSEGCFKQTKPHMAALSASGFAPRVGSEQQLKAPRPQPIRRSSSDLFECIDSFKNGMPEPQARHIFAQIVSVVASLDRQNIYHLDLKDENVVVDANFDVKIIDFGSAADRDPRLPLREFRGTWLYAAPEALRREDIFVRETEVWSLGILFSVLLLGKSIFKNQDATLAGRYSRRDFESLPKGCQDVLRCCLAHKPQHRISIANLCRHPYLRSAVQSYELKINQTE